MAVQDVGVQVEELSLPEAALAIERTWHVTYALVLTGQLRARQVRGRWLVDRGSVDRFLARRDRAAPGGREPAGVT